MALEIARYVVENNDDEGKMNFDEDREIDKTVFTQRLTKLLTQNSTESYEIFEKDENPLRKEIWKQLAGCKLSLEETIKLDDDNDTGMVSLEGLKESFEVMELELEDKYMEYIYYVMFKESEDLEHIKYQPLFDLLDEEDPPSEVEEPSDV